MSPSQLRNLEEYYMIDASEYPIFKNDSSYDAFHKLFYDTLKKHRLYDVIDPIFDDSCLDYYSRKSYEEETSFVYTVLLNSLQTAKGKELLEIYRGQPQLILSELYNYYTVPDTTEHVTEIMNQKPIKNLHKKNSIL